MSLERCWRQPTAILKTLVLGARYRLPWEWMGPCSMLIPRPSPMRSNGSVLRWRILQYTRKLDKADRESLAKDKEAARDLCLHRMD